MTTQSIPRNLTNHADRVRQNHVLPSNTRNAATNSEVTIRPLPPEIEKLVRKYLSRY